MDRLTFTIYILFITFLFVNSLHASDVEGEMKSLLQKKTYKRYFKENVINATSWNIDNFPAGDVCKYMKEMKSAIIGFQAVQQQQLKELSKCLPMYRYFSGPTDHSTEPKYNPVFYKRSRYIKVVDKGAFWLGNDTGTPGSSVSTKYNTRAAPRICTWIKLIFAERKNDFTVKKPTNKFKEILRTLQGLIRVQINGRKEQKRRLHSLGRRKRKFIRPRYIWSTIYVANTQLDGIYEDVTIKQMELLKDHFKKTIMSRRRYPLIFMGDLGWNYDSKLYKLIDDQGWMIDAVKYAAKSPPLSWGNKNYIMQNRLKSLLSGVMFSSDWPFKMRVSHNRPLFAAFLTERSPMKDTSYSNRRN